MCSLSHCTLQFHLLSVVPTPTTTVRIPIKILTVLNYNISFPIPVTFLFLRLLLSMPQPLPTNLTLLICTPTSQSQVLFLHFSEFKFSSFTNFYSRLTKLYIQSYQMNGWILPGLKGLVPVCTRRYPGLDKKR